MADVAVFTPVGVTRGREAPAYLREVCLSFETQRGGRLKVLEACLYAPVDGMVAVLVPALADPTRWLADLLQEHSVSLAELAAAYLAGATAKLAVEARDALAVKAPAILDHMVKQAGDHEQVCLTCHGRGHVFRKPETVCPECKGETTTMQLAKFTHQKVVLELAGVLKGKEGGGGTQVNIDARKQATVIAGGDYLLKQQQATDRLLYSGETRAQLPDVRIDEG